MAEDKYVNPLRADTDEKKRDICDRIYAAWVKCPELRLGQLLSSVSVSAGRDLFYLEDVTLVESCERFKINAKT